MEHPAVRLHAAGVAARFAGAALAFALAVSAHLMAAGPAAAITYPAANAPITMRFFAAGSPWTADVSALPVDARSRTYLTSMGLDTEVHADFGTVWDGGPNGIPYVLVRSTQPKVPVHFYYASESDPGPYPIPRNAPREYGSDHHILVLDVDSHKLYEVYDARYNATLKRWDCGSGAIWDLDAMPVRPDGWTSADAAGLAMLPGLVRYDEVSRGEITHALRFTVPATRKAFIWPALHFADWDTNASLPPMGLRVRLKKSLDISSYPTQVQVILRALKKYGMIVADDGGPWYIQGAPDRRWNDELLHAISRVKGSDFEVVDTSRLKPVKPLVYAGRPAMSRKGAYLSRYACFADPRGSRWTATADWGDGTRSALAVLANKRLRLYHRYTTLGPRTVTVSVRDARGAVGTTTLRINVVP